MTDEIQRLDDEIQRLEKRLRAHASAARKTLREAMREPTVAGSTGQPKAHPGFEVAERHDRLALEIAEQLRELRRQRQNAALMEPFAEVDRLAMKG